MPPTTAERLRLPPSDAVRLASGSVMNQGAPPVVETASELKLRSETSEASARQPRARPLKALVSSVAPLMLPE